jgi:beta-lactamase regulating signal transducer with metallopeptidase domain
MAVFYSFYWLALRKETFFETNRLYLMVTLIVSLIFPLIRIYIDLNFARAVAIQAPVYIGNYMQNVDIGMSTSEEKSMLSWQDVLMMIYGVGVTLLAIRFFFSVRAIVLLKAKATMTIMENQVCALSPQVKSPFSFLNVVYLPSNHSFSLQEIGEVICHERAHVEGKHSWDVIILELLSVFLWPNPLVYFYKKSIKEIHEFIADAAVVKKTPWIIYSEFLIQQKEKYFQSSLTSPLSNSLLKKRVLMLTELRSPGKAKWKFIGIIPLLILLLGLVSCQQQTEFTPKESTPYAPIEEKIDTISLNIHLQYFMNGYEITKESLSNAIRTSANHNLQRIVILRADRHNTVGDIGEVLDVAEREDARMVLLDDSQE